MSMPPSLIGAPVAFLPVPLPQTAFAPDAVEPTGAAGFAPASAVSVNARAPTAAHATPILTLVDLIVPPMWIELRRTDQRLGRRGNPRPRHGSGSRQVASSSRSIPP